MLTPVLLEPEYRANTKGRTMRIFPHKGNLENLRTTHLRARSPKKGKPFLGGRKFTRKFPHIFRDFPGHIQEHAWKFPVKCRPNTPPQTPQKNAQTEVGHQENVPQDEK